MVELDFNNIRQETIGSENGIDVDLEFNNFAQRINDIIEFIKKQQNSNSKYSWINFCKDKELLNNISQYSDMVKGKFNNIIMVGSPNSLYGLKAVTDSLLPFHSNSISEKENKCPKYDFLSSIDPYEFNGLTANQDLKKSLFVIICPEEPTPDIMSIFMLTKKRLEWELGENYRMHMVICTGSKLSVLNQLASQEGYKSFDFYENLSGCFSVFSPCGIVPLSLLQIDIVEFLSGVEDAFCNMQNNDLYTNKAAQLALIHYLFYVHKNKNHPVFVPFFSRLNALTEWCCKVESNTHCKTYDKDGNPLDREKFPNYTEKCSDYNSLFHMLNQSNNNKIINIFMVKKFDVDNVIPEIFDYTAAGYLGGKSLSKLMEAKINAVKMTLIDYQRPNVTISIPEITPFYIGQFLGFYMGAMIIQAYLYNVDPFAKADSDTLLNYIYAQMGRYGYEATYREMQNKMHNFMT